MELNHMNIQAVIFDIYGTLLEVGLPPADADTRWQQLFRDLLKVEPRLSRLEFSVAISKVIAREHETDRKRGIAFPEVRWPAIVSEVLPELNALSPARQDEFLLRQIQSGHTTWMTTEAALTLRFLKDRRVLIGIASNAQAYTLTELDEALRAQQLDFGLFEKNLCFWSYEHGFSKPDPHVFQILTVRLAARGISTHEILMVGDHAYNDIAPAKIHGWHAWHLGPAGDGDWHRLRQHLREPSIPAKL
jgi:FMN phosphatase YigB (HAD superfamily)